LWIVGVLFFTPDDAVFYIGIKGTGLYAVRSQMGYVYDLIPGPLFTVYIFPVSVLVRRRQQVLDPLAGINRRETA